MLPTVRDDWARLPLVGKVLIVGFVVLVFAGIFLELFLLLSAGMAFWRVAN